MAATARDPELTTSLDNPSIEQYASMLRHDAYPIFMWGTNRGLPLADAPIPSFRKYIDDFVQELIGEEAVNPLVRILIEQLLLSHQVIGRLCCDALDKSDAEVRRTNLQLAITLMGEARRQTKELLQAKKTVNSSKSGKKERGEATKLGSKIPRKSSNNPSMNVA